MLSEIARHTLSPMLTPPESFKPESKSCTFSPDEHEQSSEALARELLQRSRTLILATAGNNSPHTSLMSYVWDEATGEIIIATPEDTLKTTNMESNPNVSAMLTDSGICAKKHSTAKPRFALTIDGSVKRITHKDQTEIAQQFIKRYPDLEDFVHNEKTLFFRIVPASGLFATGVDTYAVLTKDQLRKNKADL